MTLSMKASSRTDPRTSTIQTADFPSAVFFVRAAAALVASASLLLWSGIAAADDNPLGLSITLSPDLRQIYPSPQLDYLTPHVEATFANSLRWQKERFGWTPSQPVTVYLKDFADFGNAGATPTPRTRCASTSHRRRTTSRPIRAASGWRRS